MDGLSVTGQAPAARPEPQPEIIAELQVLTNRFDAEYGRASPARRQRGDKTGSNQFRGAVYDYIRDDG